MLACAQPPDTVDDLVAAWRADPAAAEARLEALDDPLLRAAAVLAIARAAPGQAGALCALVPAGPDRDHCASLDARPHLAQPLRRRPDGSLDLGSGQHAAGPGSLRDLVASGAVTAPAWPDAPAAALACVDVRDPIACAAEAARERARKGQPALALGACAAIEPDQWRWDCAFRAAEELTGRAVPSARQAADAAWLCAHAGPYAPDCLHHLAADLSRLAPASPGADWQPLQARLGAIEAALQDVSPPLARGTTELAWAQATWVWMDGQAAPTGDPRLPADARPHLRAALAWRLATDGDLEAADLATARARAAAALARPPGAARTPPRRDYDTPNLWTTLAPDERARPRLPYLAQAMRPADADPALDLDLALLEAAARATPPLRSLLDEAAASPEPGVAASAQRLRAAVSSAN